MTSNRDAPTLRERQLEWVIAKAEELVRYNHGDEAAYCFTEAWCELPQELRGSELAVQCDKLLAAAEYAFAFLDSMEWNDDRSGMLAENAKHALQEAIAFTETGHVEIIALPTEITEG